jgi:hypothetical protein
LPFLGDPTRRPAAIFKKRCNNQGNTTRVASLIVNSKEYTVTVKASPAGDGTVGGGIFAEGSTSMLLHFH